MPDAQPPQRDTKPETGLPRGLVTLLHEQKIIPFIGAGVSMAVRRVSGGPLFPSWKELLQRAAERLKAEGSERHTKHANLVTSLIEMDNPEHVLLAARSAAEGLRSDWYVFLQEQFDHSSDAADANSLELARLVWGLGSKLVITTNYDNVLRWAHPRPGDVATWRIESAANQANMLRQSLKKPVVWHLHGHVDDVENLILTPDGYNHLYPREGRSETRYKAALDTLQIQLKSYSFLFVGFSLNDAHFSEQLRQVERVYKGATRPHYVLLSKAEADRFDRDDAPGIEVITFEAHGEPLLGKLRELIAAGEAVEPTLPGITSSVLPPSPAAVGQEPSAREQKGDPSDVASSSVVTSRRQEGKKGRQPARKVPSTPNVSRDVVENERGSQSEESGSTDSSEFGADIEEVKQAIRAEFDLIKDGRMRDDKGIEIGVREGTARELDPGRSWAGGDLSERLADFLTGRCDYRDLAKLLTVFQRLRGQKKHDEARRVGVVMDRLLTLCLPPNLAAEAWRQLEKDKEVLLRTGVGGKTGAELIVARLYRQGADFVDKHAKEPRGAMLAAFYEEFPIDDPDANEAAVLRDLYVATHHPEVKIDEHQNFRVSLSTDEIRASLNGYFQHDRDHKKRPWYCVVQLPAQESDVTHLARFLRGLGLDDLLFIGIAPKRDTEVLKIERYIINNLNTRSTYENSPS